MVLRGVQMASKVEDIMVRCGGEDNKECNKSCKREKLSSRYIKGEKKRKKKKNSVKTKSSRDIAL